MLRAGEVWRADALRLKGTRAVFRCVFRTGREAVFLHESFFFIAARYQSSCIWGQIRKN